MSKSQTPTAKLIRFPAQYMAAYVWQDGSLSGKAHAVHSDGPHNLALCGREVYMPAPPLVDAKPFSSAVDRCKQCVKKAEKS